MPPERPGAGGRECGWRWTPRVTGPPAVVLGGATGRFRRDDRRSSGDSRGRHRELSDPTHRDSRRAPGDRHCRSRGGHRRPGRAHGPRPPPLAASVREACRGAFPAGGLRCLSDPGSDRRGRTARSSPVGPRRGDTGGRPRPGQVECRGTGCSEPRSPGLEGARHSPRVSQCSGGLGPRQRITRHAR